MRRLFGPRQHLTPSGSLYRWLLPQLAPASLEWALASWVRQTRPSADPEPVALDGKTARGAGSAGHQAPHLLSVSTHQSQETLAEVSVDAKTNEIPVGQALLPWLPLQDRVVTADALHTHAPLAQGILDQGGDYLLCVKENQGHLYAALVEYFTDPAATYEEAQTVERQHGRIERRTLRVTDALNAYLAGFPGVAQTMEIRRQVQDRRGIHEETGYFITSCASCQVDPLGLLALSRGHWQIESHHWIRDMDFGEVRSCVRSGHTPQILAALRNAVLTLIRRTGTTQIAAARRHFAAHPTEAFRLIQQRAALC